MERHGKGEVDSQINSVKDIINYINNIEYKKLKTEKHVKKIKEMHKTLFPPRGGLSDFFIWSNDYDERIRLNEPLDKVRKEIWEILSGS